MSGYQLISNYLEGIIKGYLFGLGAMLVGAGLMFVLMHGEVSAVSISEDISNVDENSTCEFIKVKIKNPTNNKEVSTRILYCKIRDLTCIDSEIIGKHSVFYADH